MDHKQSPMDESECMDTSSDMDSLTPVTISRASSFASPSSLTLCYASKMAKHAKYDPSAIIEQNIMNSAMLRARAMAVIGNPYEDPRRCLPRRVDAPDTKLSYGESSLIHPLFDAINHFARAINCIADSSIENRQASTNLYAEPIVTWRAVMNANQIALAALSEPSFHIASEIGIHYTAIHCVGIAMTSYPGCVHADRDLMDSVLKSAILETTGSAYDSSVSNEVKKCFEMVFPFGAPGSVQEMVALQAFAHTDTTTNNNSKQKKKTVKQNNTDHGKRSIDESTIPPVDLLSYYVRLRNAQLQPNNLNYSSDFVDKRPLIRCTATSNEWFSQCIARELFILRSQSVSTSDSKDSKQPVIVPELNTQMRDSLLLSYPSLINTSHLLVEKKLRLLVEIRTFDRQSLPLERKQKQQKQKHKKDDRTRVSMDLT